MGAADRVRGAAGDRAALLPVQAHPGPDDDVHPRHQLAAERGRDAEVAAGCRALGRRCRRRREAAGVSPGHRAGVCGPQGPRRPRLWGRRAREQPLLVGGAPQQPRACPARRSEQALHVTRSRPLHAREAARPAPGVHGAPGLWGGGARRERRLAGGPHLRPRGGQPRLRQRARARQVPRRREGGRRRPPAQPRPPRGRAGRRARPRAGEARADPQPGRGGGHGLGDAAHPGPVWPCRGQAGAGRRPRRDGGPRAAPREPDGEGPPPQAPEPRRRGEVGRRGRARPGPRRAGKAAGRHGGVAAQAGGRAGPGCGHDAGGAGGAPGVPRRGEKLEGRAGAAAGPGAPRAREGGAGGAGAVRPRARRAPG
mmetsp:Transcript_85544/g.242604  ORF Transcript_85544/g.242604 Transcript_85544/m.242604 type:complete len:368 (+) Transcript_85544:222-1325(+)